MRRVCVPRQNSGGKEAKQEQEEDELATVTLMYDKYVVIYICILHAAIG